MVEGLNQWMGGEVVREVEGGGIHLLDAKEEGTGVVGEDESVEGVEGVDMS